MHTCYLGHLAAGSCLPANRLWTFDSPTIQLVIRVRYFSQYRHLTYKTLYSKGLFLT
jgi:hypothetical protein